MRDWSLLALIQPKAKAGATRLRINGHTCTVYHQFSVPQANKEWIFFVRLRVHRNTRGNCWLLRFIKDFGWLNNKAPGRHKSKSNSFFLNITYISIAYIIIVHFIKTMTTQLIKPTLGATSLPQMDKRVVCLLHPVNIPCYVRKFHSRRWRFRSTGPWHTSSPWCKILVKKELVQFLIKIVPSILMFPFKSTSKKWLLSLSNWPTDVIFSLLGKTI